MKVTISSTKIFNPITVELILESAEEVDALDMLASRAGPVAACVPSPTSDAVLALLRKISTSLEDV